VIVPVEETSSKEEYSAATLRPKLHKILPKYLVKLEEQAPKFSSLSLEFDSLNVADIEDILAGLNIDRSVQTVSGFHGGALQASRHLHEFLNNKLDRYSQFRNDPNKDCLSDMSPYLHFGQISPLEVALKTMESRSLSIDVYLDELIIRRELSINFLFYNHLYDTFDGLPGWAKKTLQEHKQDRREYIYSLTEFESAKTHDPYWNAAQRQMALTGKMHGYMRMYWGKKIAEWSKAPEDAFQTCLYLNNKYELDGRDPNGFAGVSWCFGKHDRPWAGRQIFGNIRYMNAEGLRRKFDIDKYARTYILSV
jgi:deoxyribodipyrimidine photo-lyase